MIQKFQMPKISPVLIAVLFHSGINENDIKWLYVNTFFNTYKSEEELWN